MSKQRDTKVLYVLSKDGVVDGESRRPAVYASDKKDAIRRFKGALPGINIEPKDVVLAKDGLMDAHHYLVEVPFF